MSKSTLNLMIISILGIALLLTFFLMYKNTQKIYKTNETLNSMSKRIQTLETNSEEFREEDRKEDLVMKAVAKHILGSGLNTHIGKIYVAIATRDKGICEFINNSNSKKLCQTIFEGKCAEKYKSPNKQMCAKKTMLLRRKTSSEEIKSFCNNKEMMETDYNHGDCYQYFVNTLNKPELCEEICKKPIDNSLCGQCTIKRKGETVSCAEEERRICREKAK